MALTIKRGLIWRGELENTPGTFATALEPFSRAKSNLQIVMGYTSTKPGGKGTIEVFPVVDKAANEAAAIAGLHSAKETPLLIVEGDDSAGIIHTIAKAIADAQINLHFAMCQSVDKKFQASFGFNNEEDLNIAEKAIKAIDNP